MAIAAITVRPLRANEDIAGTPIIMTDDLEFMLRRHMNEGIRTEIREFLNSLETKHSGIKNNLYQSIIKVSQAVKESNHKQKTICKRCGSECTGTICSVCNMILKLKENQT